MGERIFNTWIMCLLVLVSSSVCPQELVYAESEFPLSFLSYLPDSRFNPLDKFQTEVEGRIIELTCDPIIDIYEITSGQQAHRPCLGKWQSIAEGNRKMLGFNLVDRGPVYDDVQFSMEFRKLNKASWQTPSSIVFSPKNAGSFLVYYSNYPRIEPLPGEFYFPIVRRAGFSNSANPSQAVPIKAIVPNMGWGRYQIQRIHDGNFVQMVRRPEHPYFVGLKLPNGYRPIQTIRMQAFPKASITRNEQFIAGRVHMLTSVTPAERSYILHSAPNVQMSTYSDDSFTGFMYQCNNPYLKQAPIRRAINYAFRKKLALQKLLGNEGEIISGPIPKRNFFYNLMVPPYSDDMSKALDVIRLYISWGLDVYEDGTKVIVGEDSLLPQDDFQAGDWIQSVERVKIESIADLSKMLSSSKDTVFRLQVARQSRILTKRLQRGTKLNLGVLSTIEIRNGQMIGFPNLVLIANNPEGKNPLVKEICGALMEDLGKIGIKVINDYLDNQQYYPRLQTGKFDLALRTLKITGTPSLTRMFYKNPQDTVVTNSNFGNYSNNQINAFSKSLDETTDIVKVRNIWKKAHEVLRHDPPYIYLWSRNHIILYDKNLQVITPNPEYKVPYGYTKINGLINVFNEVHLWAWAN